MNLAEALRLENTSRLALVGAGGKTSALFAAASALGQRKSQISPILLTTTTHLAIEQCKFGNYHFKIQFAEEVLHYANEVKAGIVLFTGTGIKDGRIAGPDKQALAAIFYLAESHTWPLLVEADGSRLHPLKAPVEHEPAIPEWANHVVVCAGLSGLDRPLNQETVHRPEIYAQLSETKYGTPITAESIVKVLKHPAGGLKSIPAGARRSVLLNQADTPHKQATARRMAEQLLDTYDSVIISNLDPSDGKPAVFARIERTAGIILAAGSASRLGQPKQLLEWQGETFIHRVARTALHAGLDPIYVVTGAYAEQVEASLQDLPVHFVFNQNWETGQGTSVAAGVQALPSRVGAAVFLLVDQPWTPPGLISALIETHAVDGYPIIGPLFDGKRGNPVLFDCRTFLDLSQLKGEEGGRSIFSRYQVHWLPWHDASAGLDIDTPADLKRLSD
jgi:molybdenum cofactor cytidylyltransferase